MNTAIYPLEPSKVVATSTRHSELNRRILLDWIKSCADEDRPMPSDEAIADRFGFVSVEQARTLLADLADRGLIRIKHQGKERIITLGGARPHRNVERAGPCISVRKPTKPVNVDRGVQKIMDILKPRPAAEPKFVAPRKPAEPQVAPAPAKKPWAKPTATRLEKTPAVFTEPTPSPAPAPKARTAPKHPKAVRRRRTEPYVDLRKQLNIRLCEEAYPVLDRQRREDEELSATARRLLEELLLGESAPRLPRGDRMVPMTGKPLVRATVLKAANEEGADLHVFVGKLIDIGLRHYRKGDRD